MGWPVWGMEASGRPSCSHAVPSSVMPVPEMETGRLTTTYNSRPPFGMAIVESVRRPLAGDNGETDAPRPGLPREPLTPLERDTASEPVQVTKLVAGLQKLWVQLLNHFNLNA